jgi:uncharacterized membrane protein
MASGNGASPPVRPVAETEKDFDRTLCAALAPFARMMSQRQRGAALDRARQEILAAVEVALKAEKRRVVAALTPAELRKEVRELLDSHEQLFDYVDNLGRQPVIAREIKRLRSRGEIPWPL